MQFDNLLSPLVIRNLKIRNRIFSTGHMTRMTADGKPTDQMVAYHEARARGGAGLIICEAARVHESALSDSPAVDASTDDCIEPYAKIAQAVHHHGCKVFGQVSHSGRANDRRRGGLKGVPYSASMSPDERFHNMPRAMDLELIEEVLDAYGAAAGRMAKAGLDGVEIPASHGLLPAQFLNPRVNVREDHYGGSLENRLRFIREAILSVRKNVGEERVVGMRISVDELEHNGLESGESREICRILSEMPELDYFNVIAGSMAGLAGSIHVVPPMMVEHAYTAPLAEIIKEVTDKPVFVAGRINQPQIAEQILSSGQADMCGMTRALIADPQMPEKTMSGKVDDIRACIGCNQACIGHFHLGTSISCIQFPVTGRELQLGIISNSAVSKQVVVIGAGPAGLKAAATAAQRGHSVTLCESSGSVGGQVKLAQLLPGRSEFGGLATNLLYEAESAGVNIMLNTEVDEQWLEAHPVDSVILASGATPYRPEIPGQEDARIIDAWEVLQGQTDIGSSVVIADWRTDWIGLGLAELLARNGSQVRLVVNGMGAGQELQSYIRDQWIGIIHKLGVEVIPYARLYGVDEDSVYFQHMLSNEPIICENADTLVLALGHQSENRLESMLKKSGTEYHLAGDCLSPRSAEEAVYEGMMTGIRV
jgi:2,4-dienoyl-CoA reductase-like NADH-dependent reductase (Old Yellow Enzyme family)